MTESPAPVVPLKFRGHSSHYVDIGVRNETEFLAASVEYATHPSNIGCFIIRFVAHGKGVEPKNYTKHLMYRETAKFLIPATKTTGAEVFNGLRLSKIAIPVFKPAIHKHEVDHFATKFDIWPVIAAWITQQAGAEGFEPLLDPFTLVATLRERFVPSITSEGIENVLELPDLSAPEQKAAALKLVKKPAEPEDTDEDESEDGDEDEKEWLN